MLKRMIIVGLWIFMLGLSSCEKQNDKPFYHNGSFSLYNKELGMDFLIVREDSLQCEYNLTTGDSSRYAVEWENDSLYTLQIVEGPREMLEFFADRKLVVTLLDIHQDSLVVVATFDDSTEGKEIVMHINSGKDEKK